MCAPSAVSLATTPVPSTVFWHSTDRRTVLCHRQVMPGAGGRTATRSLSRSLMRLRCRVDTVPASVSWNVWLGVGWRRLRLSSHTRMGRQGTRPWRRWKLRSKRGSPRRKSGDPYRPDSGPRDCPRTDLIVSGGRIKSLRTMEIASTRRTGRERRADTGIASNPPTTHDPSEEATALTTIRSNRTARLSVGLSRMKVRRNASRAAAKPNGTPITSGFHALVFKASRGIEDIHELTKIRKGRGAISRDGVRHGPPRSHG